MSDLYLRVYADRSVLVHEDGSEETFWEGASSAETQVRYNRIIAAFSNGFLEQRVQSLLDGTAAIDFAALSDEDNALIDRLVGSITSEVGRALVGLTILQLSIKSIEPQQSIRLHKGGRSTRDFSWRDGISMRSLDSRFVTPVLRQYGLLMLNADGFMMTRSLAENYPYSQVYKANMRGARDEWLQLITKIESQQINSDIALSFVLAQLVNRANRFQELAERTLGNLRRLQEAQVMNRQAAAILILDHIRQSDYAARLMEIAMHSLIQALIELNVLGLRQLSPLSQMRSANKKYGNVGDVEVLEDGHIVEAWDAKYGKTYLRDELEELREKLSKHESMEKAGFVTSDQPERLDELARRIAEIEAMFDISLEILTFDQWLEQQFARAESIVGEQALAKLWLTAYTESIAQRRRELAPIDEPCFHWLELLNTILVAT